MSDNPRIVNLADLALQPQGNGAGFQAQTARIGPQVGAEKLGYTLVVVPPGSKAWPYHLQHANEEMFVILEGEGTLRYEGETYPVKAGDVIAAPTGKAHQLLNTSAAELRYLAISTMIEPEISEYPDSNKRAMMAGSPPRPPPLPPVRPGAHRRRGGLLGGGSVTRSGGWQNAQATGPPTLCGTNLGSASFGR